MVDIGEWAGRRVEEFGHLEQFSFKPAAARQLVEHAIACLADPRCEGSEEVLAAIVARRIPAGAAQPRAIYAEEGDWGDAASDP